MPAYSSARLQRFDTGTNAATRAIYLARLAREALIAEAELTPKPGLVDGRGPGAHHDLTLDSMRSSAFAIEPHLQQMASLCIGQSPTQRIRESLALCGREAERDMLLVTGGSNSHRGAIWSLGLLIGAAAMHGNAAGAAGKIAFTAGAIARFPDAAAPRLLSHGQLVAARFHAGGARAEAAAGFPHVAGVGLPALRAAREGGASEREARLDSLLSIMASLQDTCILYRGGPSALQFVQQAACSVLSAGGCSTLAGARLLRHLDSALLSRHLSPGGSADILSATLFLDAVERNLPSIQPDLCEQEALHGAS